MTGYKKVFLDTAPIIYFLEKNDTYYDKMRAFFQKVITDDLRVCTSAITYEEYKVGPLKNNDEELILLFENFIAEMNFEIINIDRFIGSRAAALRVKYPGYKGMDALQISSAITGGCDLFLTNDKQLRQTKEIRCKTVDEIGV